MFSDQLCLSHPALAIVINPGGSATGYGFSVSEYSINELVSKKHEWELEKDEEGGNFVFIDSRMMGVGGYDSWTPNVDSEFLISCQSRSFTTKLLLSLLE